MQQHNWSSANPKEPMSHLSLFPCTGSRLQLASSSRHWYLHLEQPQAQHPPTSTPLRQSISPPEVWDLRVSDASWCHHREAQKHSPSTSIVCLPLYNVLLIVFLNCKSFVFFAEFNAPHWISQHCLMFAWPSKRICSSELAPHGSLNCDLSG